MGRSQRDKGARFERKIANWLSEVLGQKVHRQTNEPQQGNVGDVVVSLSPSMTLIVQAKHQKQPSPWKAIQEAEEAVYMHDHDFPVACIRRHGGEDLVVMRPDVFGALLRCLNDLENNVYGSIPCKTDPW